MRFSWFYKPSPLLASLLPYVSKYIRSGHGTRMIVARHHIDESKEKGEMETPLYCLPDGQCDGGLYRADHLIRDPLAATQ